MRHTGPNRPRVTLENGMHTDEYEISLSRELDVCRKNIRKLQKSLRAREKKHAVTTETFLEEYPGGRFPSKEKDFADWHRDYEALARWEQKKTEFEEIFYRMKI